MCAINGKRKRYIMKNYRIRILLGAYSKALRPIMVILDTGIGPKLIRISAFPEEYQWRIQSIVYQELNSASRKSVQLEEFVPLFVNNQDMTTNVWFGVADRLARRVYWVLPLPTDTAKIFSTEESSETKTVKPVSISDDQKREHLHKKTTVVNIEDDEEDAEVTAVLKATIQAGFEGQVLVRTH